MGWKGYLLPTLLDSILVGTAISLSRAAERGPEPGPMISCPSWLADFQQMPFSQEAEHMAALGGCGKLVGIK